MLTIVRSFGRAFCRFIYLGMNPKCFGLVVFSLALFIFLASEVPAQVDVTEKVRKNTALDEKIRDFCASYCQGNRSEGHLVTVTAQPIGNGRYRGVMVAELRNWQETGDPFNLTIFDWIVRVRTEALIDGGTCTAVIDSVTVDNDMYGVFSNIVGDQKGQKYQIPNCKRILP